MHAQIAEILQNPLDFFSEATGGSGKEGTVRGNNLSFCYNDIFSAISELCWLSFSTSVFPLSRGANIIIISLLWSACSHSFLVKANAVKIRCGCREVSQWRFDELWRVTFSMTYLWFIDLVVKGNFFFFLHRTNRLVLSYSVGKTTRWRKYLLKQNLSYFFFFKSSPRIDIFLSALFLFCIPESTWYQDTP